MWLRRICGSAGFYPLVREREALWLEAASLPLPCSIRPGKSNRGCRGWPASIRFQKDDRCIIRTTQQVQTRSRRASRLAGLHRHRPAFLATGHGMVKRVALHRYASGFGDEPAKFFAGHTLGRGRPRIVIDLFLYDRSIKVIGAKA